MYIKFFMPLCPGFILNLWVPIFGQDTSTSFASVRDELKFLFNITNSNFHWCITHKLLA